MEKFSYIFIIYSCFKNIEKAKLLLNLISNNITSLCKCYIIYGREIDKDYEIIENNIICLNVEDDYDSLNLKTIKLLKVINILFPNILGMFKCDDDIIPNINYLNYFLENYLNNNIIDYCGKRVNVEKEYYSQYNIIKNSKKFTEPIYIPPVKYCGGPMYYLSNKSIKIFNKDTIIDNYFEDVLVGLNLNKNSIYPQNVNLYCDNINNIIYTSYHNKINIDLEIIFNYFLLSKLFKIINNDNYKETQFKDRSNLIINKIKYFININKIDNFINLLKPDI